MNKKTAARSESSGRCFFAAPPPARKEALYGRGMTQAELEEVKLSNKVSDEDKDFVMCAAYAGGILREGGFELNDYSLQSVDCLYKELSGGEYKNPKRKKHFVFDPHPGVKGKIVLDDEGPLAQQDALTVEQQYEKLLATGVVSAGDVIFVTHDRKGKDISHVMIVNGTDESEIRYCGETTARYDHPLSAYIEGERKNNRKPHIEIFLLHK